MSAKPKILPPVAAATPYPISPQEALVFGRLLAQREQIEGALQGALAQAKARLGLAVEAQVEVDVGAAVYRVRA